MAANSQFSVAVHIMTMMAKCRDAKLTSEYLASSVNTNAVVIRRLMSQLKQAGLVVSQAGAAGGTELSRCPDKVRLVDIYRAVSCGEVFALHTKSPNEECPVGANIESFLCNLQKEIDGAISEKLSRYTLADVMELIYKKAA